MASNQILIVGAGNVGRLLLQSLSPDFSIICIDTDAAALEAAQQLREARLQTIVGDATSRLQLEELGIAEVNTVILSSTTEKINLEVARVLHEHFNVPLVVALGITKEGIDQLERYGAEVENIFSVSAKGIRNRLELKTKTAHGIGLEQDEILEVEVHPHSRLANKRLSLFRRRKWRVGIIYRDGKIIVPTGDTVLRGKDRLVLLGEPRDIRAIADLLSFRVVRFPLEYGDTLVVSCPRRFSPEFFAEIDYLCEILPLESALFVCPDSSDEWQQKLLPMAKERGIEKVIVRENGSSDLLATLSAVIQKEAINPALLVLPRASIIGRNMPFFSSLRAGRVLRNLVSTLRCPILLAGGTFPYASAAVPCITPDALQRSLETTMELASILPLQIETLSTRLSEYIAEGEEIVAAQEMTRTVTDLARLYRTDIRTTELKGNPVRSFVGSLTEHQLLVVDLSGWHRRRWFSGLMSPPETSWEVVRRSTLSTLLVRPVEGLE